MTTRAQQIEVPPSWPGSLPEYIAYITFEQLGKVPGEDFSYQSSRMGGRLDKGGVVLDFVFTNPPDLAVNVQGVYYHYETGVNTQARDIFARAQVEGAGVRLIFIDDDDLFRDPEYYCREALNYRDHSRMAGG
jgi:hypothetical protein